MTSSSVKDGRDRGLPQLLRFAFATVRVEDDSESPAWFRVCKRGRQHVPEGLLEAPKLLPYVCKPCPAVSDTTGRLWFGDRRRRGVVARRGRLFP